MTITKKTIFIIADHGLAIIYFLQSRVVSRLIEQGVRVVLLTQDELVDQIRVRFSQPGLIVEGSRYDKCEQFSKNYLGSIQWWLNFLRRVGTSNQINTEAMDSYIRQVGFEARGRQKRLFPLMMKVVKRLRYSKSTRQLLVKLQMLFTTDIYGDLFEKYQPEMVVSSTYGWRNDRYILREAHKHGILAGAVIVGWDNPSSYGIPAAPLDFITCWSETQKSELVEGSDWEPSRVNIGGIPSYDNYFSSEWLIPRDEYFAKHNLDPDRKLIGYACSFVTFSPNYRNIAALAGLVTKNSLSQPSQLLVRLHPNHYLNDPFYSSEREKIKALIDSHPNLHLVKPVALAGDLGNYSGEDMDEKTSMMAHSDVFTTVFSTMCVECAIHDRPIISVTLDIPGGWNNPGKFSLALTEIDRWPTHSRFLKAGAGCLADSEEMLHQHLEAYLADDSLHRQERAKFVKDEVTYTDGSAGVHTADYLFSLLKKD